MLILARITNEAVIGCSQYPLEIATCRIACNFEKVVRYGIRAVAKSDCVKVFDYLKNSHARCAGDAETPSFS